MLEGFKQYNMTIGTASVSITENGIAFSKTTIIKMDKVLRYKRLGKMTKEQLVFTIIKK